MKKNAKKASAGKRPTTVFVMRPNKGRGKAKANRGRHHHHHAKKSHRRRNPGVRGRGMSGISDLAINGLFVIAGALGTKLLSQMILGANNTGFIGYGVSLLAGGVMWFATDRLLHNSAASAGVISGTIVQIIIRLLNDYTPFGQYVANLGMGDYQAQAFLTPQILVDPYRNATIKFPPSLGGGAPPAQSMPAAVGVAGFDALYGGRSIY
jgi:hypothetical protein